MWDTETFTSIQSDLVTEEFCTLSCGITITGEGAFPLCNIHKLPDASNCSDAMFTVFSYHILWPLPSGCCSCRIL